MLARRSWPETEPSEALLSDTGRAEPYPAIIGLALSTVQHISFTGRGVVRA
jgi:hypothetical protein